jgi:hypothetical protein
VAACFEVANEQDRVREITHINRRGDLLPHNAML